MDNQSTERARGQSYPEFKFSEVRMLETALDTIAGFVDLSSASIDQKLISFLPLIHHLRKDVRLGGLTGVHLLVIHNLDFMSAETAERTAE